MSHPPEVYSTCGPMVRRSARIRAAESTSDDTPSAGASIPVVSCRRSKKSTTPTILDQDHSTSSQMRGSIQSNPAVDSRRTLARDSAKKRTKAVENDEDFAEDPLDFVLRPLSTEDRQRWKGWCEVESDPAFFNVMLREFGVEGVKVQEVVGLEKELLDFLPKPVYGLIFLFQFKDDDPTKQEAKCPDHIWFANQTTSNACASVALLNIVMNVPDIELGVTLESLKNFTATMTPAMRGYQVCNHDFLRQIHNSFARKMDMLNANLTLSKDVNARKSRKKLGKIKGPKEEQDQPGFHFTAFIPIDGSVWKLDGLERQPMNLGTFDNDWMDIARPLIEERMQRYEGGQIQFNLLSVCKSPLLTISTELARNIIALRAIEEQLCRLQSDWRDFLGGSDSDAVLRGPDIVYNITKELLSSAELSRSTTEILDDPCTNAEKLFLLQQGLIAAQKEMRVAIIEEGATIDQDNDRAIRRRHDYTPMIQIWIRFLAENGTLRNLVEATERV